jgi:predicted helicase
LTTSDTSIFETKNGTYRRHFAITDETLADYQVKIDERVTKEDIFYYLYGILHSPEYTTRCVAELGKMIPRIPISANFWEFSKAGRSLADLHLNYETVIPWPLNGMPNESDDPSSLRVLKMRFPRNGQEKDRTGLVVNSQITLTGIPVEAYNYQVNGKSAIEWIMDRYEVKTDKDSGIVNDPNLWSDDPRYIVDLVARIIRVSVESAELISNLPQLSI